MRGIVGARVRRRLLRWPGRAIDGMTAEDLCQEVLAVLLSRDTLSKFDEARGTLEGFVGLCTDNAMVEIERKALNRERLVPKPADIDEVAPIESPEPSPESLALGQDLERRLHAHLETKLSVAEMLLLQRIYLEMLPKDIVIALEGIDSGRYYRFRHKVRALARAFLDGES